MFLSPMLLQTAETPFNSSDYVVQPKIDGHRLLFDQSGGQVRLWTRHQTLVSRQYPELSDLLLDADCCIDGEVCITDPEGRIDFESVMARFSMSNASRITRESKRRPVNFIVWDLPYYKKDIRHLPMEERRRILSEVLPPHPLVRLVPQADGLQGTQMFDWIAGQKMEGVVYKRKHSRFVSRRSADWLKVIRWEYADVVVTAIRKKSFGWSISTLNRGELQSAGILRLGTNPGVRKTLYDQVRSLVIKEDDDCLYVQPVISIRVKYRNLTKNQYLRDPVFVNFL